MSSAWLSLWLNPVAWCSRIYRATQRLDELEAKLAAVQTEQNTDQTECTKLRTAHQEVLQELAEHYEKWGKRWPADNATWAQEQKQILSRHQQDIRSLDTLIQARKEHIKSITSEVRRVRKDMSQHEHDRMLTRLGLSRKPQDTEEDEEAELDVVTDTSPIDEEDEIDRMLSNMIHDKHKQAQLAIQQDKQLLAQQIQIELQKRKHLEESDDDEEEEEDEEIEAEGEDDGRVSVLVLSQQ